MEVDASELRRDPDTACTGFGRIRRPWYLQGKVNQEVRGVPYCWGCHGRLQTSTSVLRRRQGRQRLHPKCSAARCRRRGLFRFRERGVGALGALHHGRNSGDRQAGGEPLGSETRRCPEQAWVARHAVPSIHPRSQGRSDGVVNWRLQWTRLPQRLSARFIAGTWLCPRAFSRACRGNDHRLRERYQKPNSWNNSPAGPSKRPIHGKRMNLHRKIGDKLSKAGLGDLALMGDIQFQTGRGCRISSNGPEGEGNARLEKIIFLLVADRGISV